MQLAALCSLARSDQKRLPFSDARPNSSGDTSACHVGEIAPSGRRSRRCRGILGAQASAADLQPLPTAGPEPDHPRSPRTHDFGTDIDKDVVRRVLAQHHRSDGSGDNGPSWLTFIAQTKDSLWSVDLFRCESILLRTYSVMLVMDVFTRRIVGFGVERATD